MDNVKRSLPHDHLFTRLQPSAGKGLGVFAIRDIPQGMNPFHGEASETTLVPCAEIDRIDDPEVRRLYIDFCPVVNGDFVAPADFNRMTIAWYLNHSDDPNIVSDATATFAAARPIRKGEELTVDYTTFSDHAGAYAEAWRARQPR
jgi:hypothetical protein